ncbi:hypothetical protein [Roseateles saccharophilus]|uniref:hypothetical protein n=1 Tax=Roseateles saccharophilus TaxID=304 RepID=UPI0039EE4A48
MRKHTMAAAAALCLLSANGADAQQVGAANLERVEVAGRKAEVSRWFRAESQHIVVYSDAREEDVSQLLDNLEKLDHLLRIYVLPFRPEVAQPPKLTLFHHARLSDLRTIDGDLPADAVGLYSNCAAGVQGFGVQLERIPKLGDEQLKKSALNDSLSYAFEAYARHFLYRHTDIRSPVFFIEGLAQYFSGVRFSEQQMVVGRVPGGLARYLNFLGSGRRYSLEWEDVLEHRVANARNYGGPAGVRLEFEAKSWLLVHYMLSSDDNRKRLSRYLALVGEGLAPTPAFELAFGMKAADLGRVMWRYGLSGMQSLQVARPELPSARVKFRSLPRATGEFLLVDAALKSCPSRPAGEMLLRRATDLAAQFPDADAARLTLGRAQLDWGDPQAALSQLAPLLQDEGGNAEARALAGMAELRLAGSGQGEGRLAHLQAAQRELQSAQYLDSRSPEVALAILGAETLAPHVPDDAALQAVVSAWQASRDSGALGRAAALASAYAGHGDEAYRTLGVLAQDGRDEGTARWATQWRSRLETGVARDDILAEMRRGLTPGAAFKEWTLDKAQVMNEVERSSGLEAAAAFIKEQQQQQQSPAASPAGNPDRR